MMFVCASVADDRPQEGARNLPVRLAAHRRVARDRPIEGLGCGGIGIAAAGCVVDEARAGAVEVCLLRPAADPARSFAPNELMQIADHWATHGVLPPLSIQGAYVLFVASGAGAPAAIATDRFGIARLYLCEQGGLLTMSTDIEVVRAAFQTAPRLDAQSLYNYVFFHCIPGPRTVYEGVSKTGPAALLTWRGGHVEVGHHWQPTFAGEADRDTAPDAAALRAVLADAVAERAGERCGAFLSGGLDSSSVAGMLSRVKHPARTFTIGFDAPGYDESAFARIAADHFETEHHEYFVTPADVCAALPDIAAHYGEPFGNSSVIPTYYCARFASEHGVTTMLAGDGGDELFAGNTRYVDQDVFEKWFRVPAVVRAAVAGAYAFLPGLDRLPITRKGASYIRRANMGLPDRLHSYNFLNEFDPATVFAADWLAQVDRDEPLRIWRARFREPATASTLQRMLYLDWKFTLTDNDLVKVNQMCDLAGIEVVYPMLDNRVVDLSCRLNDRQLLRDGHLRGWYKYAMDGFLPRAIIEKGKHGFGLPFGVWMRDDAALRSMAADALARVERREIFTPGFPALTLKMHESNSAAGYYGELVWILTILELWLSAHGH